MLHIQRLSSWHEHGWVCPQKVLIGTGPLRTAGTTPVPTIATGASMGEATNSLCQHLQGTGQLTTSSQHLSHHLGMGHRRRWWWRRRRTKEWGPVALPVGVAMIIATTIFALVFTKTMAHPSTGTPTTRPQVHL